MHVAEILPGIQAVLILPITLVATGTYTKVARDSTGKLWVVYAVDESLYAQSSTDSGLTWSAAETIVTESPHFDISGLDICIDSSDVLHLVYANRPGVFGSLQLYYFYRDPVTGWSTKEDVLGNIVNLRHPKIAVDSSDDLHCVYNERTGGTARVAYVKRTSGTWGSPTILATKTSRVTAYQSQDICVDSNDYVHVVYRGSYLAPRLHYKLWNGSWQAEETLAGTGSNAQSHMAITVDSSDIVHIAWAGIGHGATYPARYQVCHISGNTGAWGSVEALTDIDGNQGYPYGMDIAINALDEIDICWSGTGYSPTNPSLWVTGNHIKYSSGAWSAVDVISDYHITGIHSMLWHYLPDDGILASGYMVIYLADNLEFYNGE